MEWKVVRDDTIRRLQLRNPTVRTESFNRPNLKYEIRPKKAGILDEVKSHPARASYGHVGVSPTPLCCGYALLQYLDGLEIP